MSWDIDRPRRSTPTSTSTGPSATWPGEQRRDRPERLRGVAEDPLHRLRGDRDHDPALRDHRQHPGRPRPTTWKRPGFAGFRLELQIVPPASPSFGRYASTHRPIRPLDTSIPLCRSARRRPRCGLARRRPTTAASPTAAATPDPAAMSGVAVPRVVEPATPRLRCRPSWFSGGWCRAALAALAAHAVDAAAGGVDCEHTEAGGSGVW